MNYEKAKRIISGLLLLGSNYKCDTIYFWVLNDSEFSQPAKMASPGQ
jgi:hypothetical protein